MSQSQPQHQFVLCPYCGHPQAKTERCVECGGLFEPLSIKSTQVSMGPWFIRDRNRPFLPGCSFDVLRKQIDAGRIKPTTIMRGPTTHQLWEIARNVPGVAHLIGYCHRCNASVKPTDEQCPSCQAKFKIPQQRDELGLYYPTQVAADQARVELQKTVAAMTGGVKPASTKGPLASPASESAASPSEIKPSSKSRKSSSHKRSSPAHQPGEDLLAEILGSPLASTDSSASDAASPEAAAPVTPTPALASEPEDLEQVQFQPSSDRSAFYTEEKTAAVRPAPAWNLSVILLIAVNVIMIVLFVLWLMQQK